MRAISALLLSLVLAIASVSMAVARGQMPKGGQIELCTEAGAVTLTLDVEGSPVPSQGPHLCPDCLSAATAFDLPALIDLPAPAQTAQTLALTHCALVLAGTRGPAAHARGPPALSV